MLLTAGDSRHCCRNHLLDHRHHHSIFCLAWPSVGFSLPDDIPCPVVTIRRVLTELEKNCLAALLVHKN